MMEGHWGTGNRGEVGCINCAFPSACLLPARSRWWDSDPTPPRCRLRPRDQRRRPRRGPGRMGRRYAYRAVLGRPGPFLVPPQPSGEPLPGTPLYDYYPRWAMNKGIRERPPV